MRYIPIVLTLAAGLGWILPAQAQYPYRGGQPSYAGSTDSQGVALPALPEPPVGENAPPSSFLRAAQSALITGRTGEARQALEMAQTRMLDRSVPLFQTDKPSANPAVKEVSMALEALSGGDRQAAMRHIQTAMQTADEVAR